MDEFHGIAVDEFHGIAVDEKHRTAKNKDRGRSIHYPLVEWNVTEAEALAYCYRMGFDWGGLYRRRSRVSCFCCPLQRLGELRDVYRHHPELWRQMLDMDKRQFRTFKEGLPLRALDERFRRELWLV